MDKIEKLLNKLSEKERAALKALLTQIKTGNLENLDIKKLVNRENIFRIRKGKLRIIIHKTTNSITILTVERRSDNTYTS
jgi:mRNA-degrading endonuclease RelE of RelBE toxin-antitoxin system